MKIPFNIYKLSQIRYDLVDGNWAEWGSWTTCSKTCNGGSRERTRACSNPLPQYDGLNCTDSSMMTVSGDGMVEYESQACNELTCNQGRLPLGLSRAN